MDDLADRFLELIHGLEEVRDAVTPERAHAAFDEIRYTAPAINMLAGRGFSSDQSEPILPSEHTVPVYPLFIAAVYSIFGQHNSAVRVAQSAIDLITCLLVAFVSFRLAPPSLKRSAAISALIIYGCLSWFTVSWTRYILTETLASFLTMLAVAVGLMAFRSERCSLCSWCRSSTTSSPRASSRDHMPENCWGNPRSAGVR